MHLYGLKLLLALVIIIGKVLIVNNYKHSYTPKYFFNEVADFDDIVEKENEDTEMVLEKRTSETQAVSSTKRHSPTSRRFSTVALPFTKSRLRTKSKIHDIKNRESNLIGNNIISEIDDMSLLNDNFHIEPHLHQKRPKENLFEKPEVYMVNDRPPQSGYYMVREKQPRSGLTKVNAQISEKRKKFEDQNSLDSTNNQEEEQRSIESCNKNNMDECKQSQCNNCDAVKRIVQIPLLEHILLDAIGGDNDVSIVRNNRPLKFIMHKVAPQESPDVFDKPENIKCLKYILNKRRKRHATYVSLRHRGKKHGHLFRRKVDALGIPNSDLFKKIATFIAKNKTFDEGFTFVPIFFAKVNSSILNQPSTASSLPTITTTISSPSSETTGITETTCKFTKDGVSIQSLNNLASNEMQFRIPGTNNSGEDNVENNETLLRTRNIADELNDKVPQLKKSFFEILKRQNININSRSKKSAPTEISDTISQQGSTSLPKPNSTLQVNLSELESMSIPPICLNYISNYLSERVSATTNTINLCTMPTSLANASTEIITTASTINNSNPITNTSGNTTISTEINSTASTTNSNNPIKNTTETSTEISSTASATNSINPNTNTAKSTSISTEINSTASTTNSNNPVKNTTETSTEISSTASASNSINPNTNTAKSTTISTEISSTASITNSSNSVTSTTESTTVSTEISSTASTTNSSNPITNTTENTTISTEISSTASITNSSNPITNTTQSTTISTEISSTVSTTNSSNPITNTTENTTISTKISSATSITNSSNPITNTTETSIEINSSASTTNSSNPILNTTESTTISSSTENIPENSTSRTSSANISSTSVTASTLNGITENLSISPSGNPDMIAGVLIYPKTNQKKKRLAEDFSIDDLDSHFNQDIFNDVDFMKSTVNKYIDFNPLKKLKKDVSSDCKNETDDILDVLSNLGGDNGAAPTSMSFDSTQMKSPSEEVSHTSTISPFEESISTTSGIEGQTNVEEAQSNVDGVKPSKVTESIFNVMSNLSIDQINGIGGNIMPTEEFTSSGKFNALATNFVLFSTTNQPNQQRASIHTPIKSTGNIITTNNATMTSKSTANTSNNITASNNITSTINSTITYESPVSLSVASVPNILQSEPPPRRAKDISTKNDKTKENEVSTKIKRLESDLKLVNEVQSILNGMNAKNHKINKREINSLYPNLNNNSEEEETTTLFELNLQVISKKPTANEIDGLGKLLKWKAKNECRAFFRPKLPKFSVKKTRLTKKLPKNYKGFESLQEHKFNSRDLLGGGKLSSVLNHDSKLIQVRANPEEGHHWDFKWPDEWELEETTTTEKKGKVNEHISKSEKRTTLNYRHIWQHFNWDLKHTKYTKNENEKPVSTRTTFVKIGTNKTNANTETVQIEPNIVPEGIEEEYETSTEEEISMGSPIEESKENEKNKLYSVADDLLNSANFEATLGTTRETESNSYNFANIEVAQSDAVEDYYEKVSSILENESVLPSEGVTEIELSEKKQLYLDADVLEKEDSKSSAFTNISTGTQPTKKDFNMYPTEIDNETVEPGWERFNWDVEHTRIKLPTEKTEQGSTLTSTATTTVVTSMSTRKETGYEINDENGEVEIPTPEIQALSETTDQNTPDLFEIMAVNDTDLKLKKKLFSIADILLDPNNFEATLRITKETPTFTFFNEGPTETDDIESYDSQLEETEALTEINEKEKQQLYSIADELLESEDNIKGDTEITNTSLPNPKKYGNSQ